MPKLTLIGKNIGKVVVSKDTIYALSKKGDRVYVLAGNCQKQKRDGNQLDFTTIAPPLGMWEHITSMHGGESHIIVLTSKNRVFTSFTGSEPVKSQEGQLGVPILLPGQDEVAEPNQFHEVRLLTKYKIVQIAAGEKHNLARDNEGRVWSFGENLYGQLGVDYTSDTAFLPLPTLIPLENLYKRGVYSRCQNIAAGGMTSFFTMSTSKSDKLDVLVSGSGVSGQHATGRFAHVRGRPANAKPLSSMSECKCHM